MRARTHAHAHTQVNGDVDQTAGMLDDDAVEAGYALLCVSEPRSDCRVRIIEEARAWRVPSVCFFVLVCGACARRAHRASTTAHSLHWIDRSLSKPKRVRDRLTGRAAGAGAALQRARRVTCIRRRFRETPSSPVPPTVVRAVPRNARVRARPSRERAQTPCQLTNKALRSARTRLRPWRGCPPATRQRHARRVVARRWRRPSSEG